MKTQAAFFDIDGTLSAPYYPVNGELKPGMTDEQWLQFCKEYDGDSYRFCKPVEPVRRYAERLRAEGAVLYVLSTSQGESEDRAKKNFIEKHYPGLFQEVLTVRKDAEKVVRIRSLAEASQIPPEACELIEDTYRIILDAVNCGLKATHIAQIVCEL